jgi:hypothetical protein
MTDTGSGGVIQLDIGGGGIPGGQDQLISLVVEYDSETSGFADQDRLISAVGKVSAIDIGSFAGVNDGDTRDVALPRNSLALYTQDVTGIITTDGTTPLEGALVRATLINANDTSGSDGGSQRYEFPDGGRFQTQSEPEQDLMKPWIAFEVNNEDDLSDKIEDAEDEGLTKFRAWMNVQTHVNGRHTAILYDNLNDAQNAGAAGITTHQVRIFLETVGTNQRGDIKVPKSGAGIVGQLFIEPTASGGVGFGVAAITQLDTELAVTDSLGNFRLNVGTDNPAADLPQANSVFIMVSVKQAGEDWVLVTSPEKNFCTFLKFKRDLDGSGSIRGDIGTVDLSLIELVEIDDNFHFSGPDGSGGSPPVGESDEGDTWQSLGFKGDICRTDASDTSVNINRLFLTIDPDDGSILSHWQDDDNTDDMAFTLRNGSVKTAMETATGTTVNNINDLRGGTGMKFDNDDVEEGTLFIPVNTVLPNSRNQQAGWQLVTLVAADGTDPALLNANVDAIIKVGNSNQASTWFTGETDNSLIELTFGTDYFVHFTATTLFDFGQ